MLYLINSTSTSIAAELTSEEKIVIQDIWIKKHIEANKGIYLNTVFREKNAPILKKNNLVDRICLINDKTLNPEYEGLFAKAFKECFFEDELRKLGYYWKDVDTIKALSLKNLELV